MKVATSILFILFVQGNITYSQIDSLRSSEIYKAKIDSIYKNWLETEIIGKYLHFESTQIKDSNLVLYLHFGDDKIDSVITKWYSLKKYCLDNIKTTIEEFLLKNMILIYQVNPNNSNILIYDSFKVRNSHDPKFYYQVYFENDTIRLDEKIIRSGVNTFFIPSNERIHISLTNNSNKRDSVYQKITNYLRRYYYNKVQYPSNDIMIKVNHYTHKDTLIAEIDNLQTEVLYDKSNPIICQIWNWAFDKNYDCRPLEYLEFKISIDSEKPLEEIQINLIGKYRASIPTSVPNPSRYNDMDFDCRYYIKKYRTKMEQNINGLF